MTDNDPLLLILVDFYRSPTSVFLLQTKFSEVVQPNLEGARIMVWLRSFLRLNFGQAWNDFIKTAYTCIG